MIPPDLWQANVQLVDGSDGMARLLAMYTSWATGEGYSKYMIRSLNITNGYISVDSPEYVQQDSLIQMIKEIAYGMNVVVTLGLLIFISTQMV